MAIVIRGAPPPGWYLPVGPSGAGCSPFLWTGIARAFREGVCGLTVSINKHASGPRAHPEWRPASKVVFLGDPACYALVSSLPDVWRGQDIRSATLRAEELADLRRAKAT